MQWSLKRKLVSNLVDEVRVEDVELVALHDFRRWVVHVVVGWVVFVPFKTGVDAVEVSRLAGSGKNVHILIRAIGGLHTSYMVSSSFKVWRSTNDVWK